MDQPGRIIEVAQLLNEKPLGEGAFSLGEGITCSPAWSHAHKPHGEDSGAAWRLSMKGLAAAACAPRGTQVLSSQPSGRLLPLSCQCVPVQ